MNRSTFFVAIGLIFFLLFILRWSQKNEAASQNGILVCDDQRLILTALGKKTYSELEKEVFVPFGYSIARNCTPFPMLKYRRPLICDAIFQEWLWIADDADPKAIPNKKIPDYHQKKFLLNGVSLLSAWYRNDKATEDSKIDRRWSSHSINELMQRPEVYMISGYNKAAACVQTAFNHYRTRITGQRGLVIGSINPWVEVLALQSGAETVTTVEYRKIEMGDQRFKYLHPVDLARNWTNYIDKFDFIASFSSIEHSGLGRYGDPPDPVGDLREMQKLWCLLQPGQLLFVGFPVGRDEVAFNVHRIYGAVRLAMMFAGWRILDVYFDQYRQPYSLRVIDLERFRGADRQMLFVLEKL